MKIAVSTDDFNKISGHVGRCKGFLIFTVENGEIKNKEIRENVFTNHGKGRGHHQEGKIEGHHSHGILASGLNDCGFLITHGAGWRLVEDLKKEGIKPVLTREIDAEKAAVKLEKGELIIDDDLICKQE